MPDGRAPISSSRISTGDIARHSFAIVRRGFDADEVRSYLQSVARNIEEFEQREQDLRAAIAEAEERAAHPVVDEATLTASLGQHSAQILRHAHEEAARIVAQAQEGASSLMRDTQSQVDELQARTESSSAERVVEIELLVANAESEARAERERILAAADAEGEAIINRAKDEGRSLLEQVQEARRRVLADLATRRKALGVQIEQLRAARDEMAASVSGVRDKVDTILRGLERSDGEARAAALAAGDQARLHGADEPHDQDHGEAPGEAADDPVVVVVEDEDNDDDAGGDGAPEDVAEPEGDGGAANEAPSVDELFARIRAGSDEPEPETDATPAETPAPAETTTAEVPAAEAEIEVEESVVILGPVDEVPPNPDTILVERRDELLTPVTAQLSRHIKRALGDDQNRLLDVLRSSPSTAGVALLGSEEEHLAVFTLAAHGHLTDAFVAGTVFAGSEAGSVPVGTAVATSASGLAQTVVTMLRRRIEEGNDDLSDRVGAAFREWRGERIERLVGDFAVQAFSAGVTAASGSGGTVRWILTAPNGCSDCDDNALAGAVSTEEAFPTGHPYPPAHSGCRCLVAPIPG
jgi:DivIVA domain-containing protein